MKRLPLVTIIGLLLVLLLVACGGETSGQTSDPNTLTAVKVDATSLDANAAYWADAPVLSVETKAAVEGNPDGTNGKSTGSI